MLKLFWLLNNFKYKKNINFIFIIIQFLYKSYFQYQMETLKLHLLCQLVATCTTLTVTPVAAN